MFVERTFGILRDIDHYQCGFCSLPFQERTKVEARKRKEREEEASTALDLHGFAALICIDDVHLALR